MSIVRNDAISGMTGDATNGVKSDAISGVTDGCVE